MGKNQELKNLQKIWERILRASGFVDIEKQIGDERVLIQHASNAYRQADEVIRENKALYFEKVSERIHYHQFRSETDRRIMQRVSEGAKIKDIVEEFRRKGRYIHRQTIRYIIRRYEHMWGLKSWSNKQMNLKPKIPIK